MDVRAELERTLANLENMDRPYRAADAFELIGVAVKARDKLFPTISKQQREKYVARIEAVREKLRSIRR